MGGRHRDRMTEGIAPAGKARAGFTRRSLVKGAAAATAALGALSLVGCGSEGDATKVSGEPQVITDDSKIVDNPLAAQSAWDLPLGTVPFHTEGAWAALLEAPASARSVDTLGIISQSPGA